MSHLTVSLVSHYLQATRRTFFISSLAFERVIGEEARTTTTAAAPRLVVDVISSISSSHFTRRAPCTLAHTANFDSSLDSNEDGQLLPAVVVGCRLFTCVVTDLSEMALAQDWWSCWWRAEQRTEGT